MARLIVVEDNAELASVIGAALEERGHQPTVALNGKDALKAIAGTSFDAALVDLLLPDIKGSELLAHLGACKVPAIAMSGVFKGEKLAAEATQVHGAKAFFEKPFEMKALIAALEKIAKAPTPEAAPSPRGGRSGSLAQSPVPRLLTACHQSHYDGELVLRQGKVSKVVQFESGRPVFAASNLAQERFGPFCLSRGAVTDEQLKAASSLANSEKLGTGAALVRLGILTADSRAELIKEQIAGIIWSTFGWSSGEYQFVTHGSRPIQDRVPVGLSPAELVLKGILKTEPLISLRKRMAKDRYLYPPTDPPYELSELPLTGGQAKLVAYTDGSKSIEDLCALTDLSEKDALGTLLGLEMLGMLVERRDERTRQRISYGL